MLIFNLKTKFVHQKHVSIFGVNKHHKLIWNLK